MPEEKRYRNYNP